ncbi:hypothetical protein KEM55_005144 [Ascosphaera atra]|nr:hypothetical protein KEM55_005144 [Ascosphaera atra]
MNAVAIIPLAYLLSFATECVASKLGDTVGALMNVTFGNAVELIIFNIPTPSNGSQILLIIYIIYLLFQLKSHRYIYQSTPQENIDEESHPGVLADILDSSSSSDSSSNSSSSDDSDNGSLSRRKRLRKALRRHHRKHSITSQDSEFSYASSQRYHGGSLSSRGTGPVMPLSHHNESAAHLQDVASGDEADAEDHPVAESANRVGARVIARDFAGGPFSQSVDEVLKSVKTRKGKKGERKKKRAKAKEATESIKNVPTSHESTATGEPGAKAGASHPLTSCYDLEPAKSAPDPSPHPACPPSQ